MKRFLLAFFLIPFFGLAQQTPAWVDDAVKVSLYFSETMGNFTCKECDMTSRLRNGSLQAKIRDLDYGSAEDAWTKDITLDREQTRNLFIDLAKLNAHKAYYRELYRQGDNFKVLPELKKHIYDTEVAIHQKYHVSSSRHFYDLTGGNSLPVYSVKCDRESKSLQEIHIEIDNWIDGLSKEKMKKLFESGSLLFNAWIAPAYYAGGFLPELNQLDVMDDLSSARSAGRNSYLYALKGLQEYAVEYGYEFDNVEAFLSKHMNKLRDINNGGLIIRKYSSIFKISTEMGDYRMVERAIFVDANDWRVTEEAKNIKLSQYIYESGEREFNPAYDWYTYEIINGIPETLFDFIQKMFAGTDYNGMSVIHNFPGLSNITNWLRLSMKLPFEDNYDYRSTYDKSKNRFYMNYIKSYNPTKYWEFHQSNLQKYNE